MEEYSGMFTKFYSDTVDKIQAFKTNTKTSVKQTNQNDDSDSSSDDDNEKNFDKLLEEAMYKAEKIVQNAPAAEQPPVPLYNDIITKKIEMLNEGIKARQLRVLEKDKDVSDKTVKLKEEWEKNKPVSSDLTMEQAMARIKYMETHLKDLRIKCDSQRKMKEALGIAEIGSVPEQEHDILALEEQINEIKEGWLDIKTVGESLEEMRTMKFEQIEGKKLQRHLENLATSLLKAPPTFRATEVSRQLMDKIDLYKNKIGLVIDLRSIDLKPHHLKSLKDKAKLDLLDPKLTFEKILACCEEPNDKLIKEILSNAQGENALEEFLRQIVNTWEEYTYQLVLHAPSGTKLVTGFDPLLELLNEHLGCLGAIKLSPFFKKIATFEERALAWESRLSNMMTLLDVWMNVQRRWVYLFSILAGSSDLKNILVKEYKKFSAVSTEFIALMKKVESNPKPIKSIAIPGIAKQFDRFEKELESIQKSLSDYLEKQRSLFPRFYFLGDDDLLEIFGNSRDLSRIVRHFKKIFAGLYSVEHSKDMKTITCLLSKENERVPLHKNIVIEKTMKVNDWLSALEKEMVSALASNLKDSCKNLKDPNTFTDKATLIAWTDKYAAQLLNVAAQIEWCARVDEALKEKDANKMEGILALVEKVLNILALLIMDEQPDLRRAKFEYLIIEYVHQRDVMRDLIQRRVNDPQEFSWLAQMRFYLNPAYKNPGEFIAIHIANAVANYGFEYLGIQEKLVQTPLTDRCYLTMTQALNQRLGGSPFGPAGTGKTESVKALGIQLGTFVLVFNCDEAFNFHAMGRIFVGLCQVGAWGCFDEFNRLEEGVLSAVSQQIQTIQEGLKLMMTESNVLVELLEHKISLSPKVAIFITMNPGYAGRSNLPNNLKQLFRGLAMTQPDRQLIAQVMLYSQGFVDAEKLSKKIVPLFKLCAEQLSDQPHYDFGLRALKSVLRSAGNLKRELTSASKIIRKKSGRKSLLRKNTHMFVNVAQTNQANTEQVDMPPPVEHVSASIKGIKAALSEQDILIQSIMQTVSPKLVSDDVPLLDSLMKDVFPDNTYKPTDVKALQHHLANVCEDQHLVYSFTPGEEGFAWTEKILQFYLINNINHGLMLVGPSGTGKTKARECLLKALQLWESSVGVAHVLNPKSIPKEKLYGVMDPNTREWNDGLFTHVLRGILTAMEQNANEKNVRHWIVFDGDVDPEWVENLNSVLDDNKILTLPNGERLQIPPNVRIIFEVENLKFATLATVSRCGMVWFSEEIMPAHLKFHSYITTLRSEPLVLKGKVIDIALQMKCQNHIADFLEPFFVKDGLVVKAIENGESHFHVMDYTHARIISTILTLTNNLATMTLQENLNFEDDEEENRKDHVKDFSSLRSTVVRQFLLHLVWSVSGDSNWGVRMQISDFIRSSVPNELPTDKEGNIIDYEVIEGGEFKHCSEKVPVLEIEPEQIVATDVVVPTIDTVRHEALLISMLHEKRPLILCGPPGSGKTMSLLSALRSFPEMEVIGMNFSCATTPEFLVFTMEQYCEYKKTPSGYIMAPKSPDKILVFFCDEMNLPNMDSYHTIHVMELIRDLVEKNYFWRTSEMKPVVIDRIIFIGACNPPTDPGRKPLSHRFLRLSSVIYVDYPIEEAYHQIYGTFTRAMLRKFENVSKYAMPLVKAKVSFYLKIQIKFTADIQPHYIYSPRELTRWVKGVYIGIAPRKELSIEMLVRLMFHEGLRLFHDRMVSEEHREWTIVNMREITASYFDEVDLDKALAPPVFFSNLMTKMYVPVKESDLRDFINHKLRTFVQEELDTKLVLSSQVLDHVLRIDRVLKQYQGHLLIVSPSGAGKNVLGHFVSWLNGLSVYRVRVHRKFTMEDFDNDLREILKKVGTQGERYSFILDQSEILDSSFLERINTLLANGEIPGLFEGEELVTLMNQVRDAAAREGHNLDSSDEIYKWFTKTICRNLHVIYTMVPTLDGLRDTESTSPALFNRCVIDWLGDWHTDTYFNVGYELLPRELEKVPASIGDIAIFSQFFPENSNSANLRHVISNAFIFIHETTMRISVVLRKKGMPSTIIAPRHFQDMCRIFNSLVVEKSGDLDSQIQHLKKGVDKIAQTVKSVVDMQQVLKKSKFKLEDMSKAAEEKVGQINVKKELVAKEMVKLEESNKELCKKEAVASAKKKLVLDSLNRVEPLINEAREAVSNIRKDDIRELKVMKNPPVLVRLALESVLFLIGENGSDWKSILAVIVRDNFMSSILSFDTLTVTDEIRAGMEKFLSNPDYNFEKINRASMACGPLVKWVIAQCEYATILKKSEPLRNELAKYEEEANIFRTSKQRIVDGVQDMNNIIENLQVEHVALIKQASNTKKNLVDVEKKVKRAISLVDSLRGEKVRWTENIAELEEEKIAVYGRCVLSAAFIGYSGFFVEMVRKQMIKAWALFVIDSGLEMGKEITKSAKEEEDDGETISRALTQYLSTSDERETWTKNGLPADQLCEENAVMLKRYNRYPLLIDPSGQAMQFLLNTHGEKIKRISILDPGFRKSIELALRLGTMILIQDVDTHDPLLNPILDREIKKFAGRAVVEIGTNLIDFCSTFQLFLETRETVKPFAQDLICRVTMINFTITRSSLKNQCFDLMLLSERPDVHKKKAEYFKLAGEFRTRLRKLEKQLLDVLAQATGNILDNDTVIKEMTAIKKSVGEINNQIKLADSVMGEIERDSADYHSPSILCSDLFFMLDALWRIHFLYYFDLQFFLRIVRSVLTGNSHLKQEKNLKTRIKIIRQDLCKLTYSKVSPGLLQEHKNLFGLLISHLYLGDLFKKSPDADKQIKTFWMAGSDMLNTEENESSEELIGNLDLEQSQFARKLLANTPGYENWELVYKSDNSAFMTWISSATPETQPFTMFDKSTDELVPKEIQLGLHSLTQMLAFRPDRLLAAIQYFITKVFAKNFLENEEGIMKFSRVISSCHANTPILLCAVTGVDPSYVVVNAATEAKQTLLYTAIGSSEGFIMTERHLATCATNGNWLLLKNVHLAPKWLMELGKRVRDMQVHESFRLFMTSEISPKLPTNIIRSARSFAIELPSGFRANLLRSLHGLSAELMERKPTIRANLYFLIVWLHALVQERLRYSGVGWTKFYEFSESDINCACATVDSWIARNNCEQKTDIPWPALCNLLSSCIYGGKMDNHVDHRLLHNLVDEVLNLSVISGDKSVITSDNLSIKIPALLTKNEYIAWIEAMPSSERPSWLGLSDNADMVLLASQARNLFTDYKKIMTSLKTEVIDLSAVSRSSQIRGRMASIVEKPEWMTNLGNLASHWVSVLPESIELLYRDATRITDPLFRFFDRETTIAWRTLNNIQNDFKMIVDMTENNGKVTADKMDIIESLQSGFPPKGWVPCVIPAGTSCNKWLQSFNDRVNQLCQVAELYADDMPKCSDLNVWLGGLFMPEAFLTATRQSVSQTNNVALEDLTLKASIIRDLGAYKKNPSGFVIARLKLVGATAYNDNTISLSESVSTDIAYMGLSWINANVANVKKPDERWMHIPMYLNDSRNILLMELEFRCIEPPNEFYKRGVALICSS